MTIIEAIQDPALLGASFKSLDTWRPWLTILRAIFNLPIEDPGDIKVFQDCTGLVDPPGEAIREAAIICGRRSGKSFISAIIAVFLACFKDWTPYLTAGERAWIFIVAVDREQARIIKDYISGILHSSKFLRRMIDIERQEQIDLKNRVSIGIKTCSFRGIRGYTVACAILEEVAFFRSDESANPDKEVMAALRPSLATIPESFTIMLSTPYSKRGILFETFRKNYGQPGKTFVWKSESSRMNPTLDKAIIKNALEDDPAAARSEWLAEWREDVQTFLSQDAVEGVVIPGRGDLPKIDGVSYSAFLDPSGGRNDSFTAAICHSEKSGKIIIDILRERRPPFKPSEVVAEFSGLLQAYGITSAKSDRYGGEWVSESFRKHGITVEPADLTASELYVEFLPIVLNGAVELPDNARLTAQLVNLERRTRTGGKDLVTHFPGGHDDLANSAAGACTMAARSKSGAAGIFFSNHSVFPDDSGMRQGEIWMLDNKGIRRIQ
jgi:hypothetical protein